MTGGEPPRIAAASTSQRARSIPGVTTVDSTQRGGVLVVIPAHDEGPRIARVVAGAIRHLPVLVVDDGSNDDTAVAAQAAGARVLRQSPNQGKGAALRAGFAEALGRGAEAVITLDGDGQHDPSEIPAFLGLRARRTIAGVPTELVVGRRSFSRMPPLRRAANLLGTVALSAAVGRWIHDNQSGFRLIGRRLMAAMLESRETGFAFEVEMIAVCLREGWSIGWVPIRTIYADETSHIRPGQHLREFLAVTGRAGRIARSRPGRAEAAKPAGDLSA
jgi:glycosyltransferase involved in cell wall biosynthesis